MVDHAECNDQEIQVSALGSHRPVDFPLGVDLLLGYFGLFGLLLDIIGRLFGVI